MKIVDIKIHTLRTPLEVPFAFSQGWVRNRSATLVEVLTDEGITGWGEAFAQGLEPPQIGAALSLYANASKDWLPRPNWKTPNDPPGWLYTAPEPSKWVWETHRTGTLWPYIGADAIYRCPAHKAGGEDHPSGQDLP